MQRSIIAPAERVTNLRWGIAVLLGIGWLVAAGALRTIAGSGVPHAAATMLIALTVLQLPCGAALDRLGGMRVVAGGALLAAIAAVLMACLPAVAASPAAYALVGIGLAPLPPAVLRAIALWFPPAERTGAAALAIAGASIGAAAGVLLSATPVIFIAPAVGAVVVAIAFFAFYRDPANDQRLTYAERNYIETGNAGAATGNAFARPALWLCALGFAMAGWLFATFVSQSDAVEMAVAWTAGGIAGALVAFVLGKLRAVAIVLGIVVLVLPHFVAGGAWTAPVQLAGLALAMTAAIALPGLVAAPARAGLAASLAWFAFCAAALVTALK